MRICVFGAASNEIDLKYVDAVENLCRKLAERGHSLVFGAGANGLMGAAARGMKAGGANIIGVIPGFSAMKLLSKYTANATSLYLQKQCRSAKRRWRILRTRS